MHILVIKDLRQEVGVVFLLINNALLVTYLNFKREIFLHVLDYHYKKR